jgi:hypothetical protein
MRRTVHRVKDKPVLSFGRYALKRRPEKDLRGIYNCLPNGEINNFSFTHSIHNFQNGTKGNKFSAPLIK